MKDFWNSQLTEKSFELLQSLKKKYKFILIGGWAVYLWTKQQKSKDIDIAVDIKELQLLKQENLLKNDRLKKYEIKTGEIDIDIYVSYFSRFTIPVEDLKRYSSKTEGFNVASPEALLILKQGAEIERRNSIKGEKDKIDILSLLFFSDIDLKKYKIILEKYSLKNYITELVSILKNFKDYNVLSLTPREFKTKKEKLLYFLRKI
jgi:hypothetical protein